MKITKQEQAVINAIAASEYMDSPDPIGHTVWGGHLYLCKSSSRPDGADVSAKALGGVMASLKAKGLVRIDEDDCEGADAAIRPASQVTLLEAARPFLLALVKS